MCGGRKQHDGAVLPLRRHLNPRRSASAAALVAAPARAAASPRARGD
jgi:hypothetical protein